MGATELSAGASGSTGAQSQILGNLEGAVPFLVLTPPRPSTQEGALEGHQADLLASQVSGKDGEGRVEGRMLGTSVLSQTKSTTP